MTSLQKEMPQHCDVFCVGRKVYQRLYVLSLQKDATIVLFLQKDATIVLFVFQTLPVKHQNMEKNIANMDREKVMGAPVCLGVA